jgi:NTE family protein
MRWPFARRLPPLSLALQGGGAHGAFTWGVLDALLEGGTSIAAASGASAGTMNAVVLAHGLLEGDRDRAREALSAFWQAVAERVPPWWHTPGDPPRLAAGHAMIAWSRWLTPAQLNPLDLNPLRDVLSRQVDFERLCDAPGIELFIATTDVARGRLHLMRRRELSIEAVLASACLPSLFPPVELDGRAHWDGAFSANPALFPLVREVAADDVLLVTLGRLGDAEVPASAAGIHARTLDIAFNATFLREAALLAQLRADALRRPWPRVGIERRLARLRWHLVSGDDALGDLPTDTRLVPDWTFLQCLRDEGRRHAGRWLDGGTLGRRSSVDLARTFGA